MGAQASKSRNDVEEPNQVEEDDLKNKKKKKSFKDKVKTRISKSDLENESNNTEKTSIAKPLELTSAPVHPSLKTLTTDPRSPSALERTPIVVESVPRYHVHLPDDDPRSPSAAAVSRTPLRCAPPPSLTLPQADMLDTPTGDRSPLLIETEDPRSPSCLDGPRTPISADSPAANFLKTNPHTTNLATPATIELDTKVVDRGQPKQVLQLRFKETLEALQKQEDLDTPMTCLDTPLPCVDTMDTPPAAGDLCVTPRTLDVPESIAVDSPGNILGII